MNILVLVKAVPMETSAKMTDDFLIDREKTALNINIADESAVEAALRLADDGKVTVLSMGTSQAEPLLRDLLSRGVHEAVLLSDNALKGSDTFATAKALSEAVRRLSEETGFDLILTGRRAMDGETGQVPPELAEMLGRPSVNDACSFEKTADGFFVSRRVDDGEERLLVPFGAVISVTEYTYRLRLPGILGRRAALTKEIRRMDAASLGLPAETCGIRGSLTRVVSVKTLESGKRSGPRTDDPEEGAELILKSIREVKP